MKADHFERSDILESIRVSSPHPRNGCKCSRVQSDRDRRLDVRVRRVVDQHEIFVIPPEQVGFGGIELQTRQRFGRALHLETRLLEVIPGVDYGWRIGSGKWPADSPECPSAIADITAVVAVDFARVVRIKPGEQHPHLQRWRAAMALRPSMAL